MDYGPGKCCEPLDITSSVSSRRIMLDNVLTKFSHSTYRAAVGSLATDQRYLMCTI